MNRPGPAKTLARHFGHAFQKPISPFLWEIVFNLEQLHKIVLSEYKTIISKNLEIMDIFR